MMDYSRYKRYRRIIVPALKTKKAKAYGMLILSFLTASFFGIFAIRPTVTTIAKLRKEIQDDRDVERRLTEKINTLTALDQVYRQVEHDLASVEAVFPSQSDFQNLLSLIENTAIVYQLGIVSLQFKPVDLVKPEVEGGDFKVNPIAFQVLFKGGYEDLVSGLASLIKARRLITTETVQIKLSREAEEELLLEVGGRSFYVN